MKNIVGLMLIDTPHSALNNSGNDIGSRTENTVAVKKIIKRGKNGNEIYPYVSSQALRYWWRDSLKERFKWKLSPIKRESKIAFTEANPFKYDDDDVFGYMRAQSKSAGGTVTRISPLKCSPLVSVFPVNIVADYGVMARQEGDPVPYEHQFYSTIMKGVFSLDIDSVGRFSLINKTGYKNITNNMQKDWEEETAQLEENMVEMPEDIRRKRIKDTIAVIPYLYGGAKQTLHLTDVTPTFIILAEINCGNHILMNVVDHNKGRLKINFASLKEVLADYNQDIISNLYIGKRKGFIDELEEEITEFIKELEQEKVFKQKVIFSSVNTAVNQFIQEIIL